MNAKDREFLLAHALRIWRYFREFGVERHNFLVPDNVVEEGLREAPRVSPTNIGLLLNARQAACELGFLTAPEFAALTGNTLATIERMEKFRGHLYNWYDSETLRPLDTAPFVSSVDSGNLVASLFTLQAGTHELANKPLLHAEIFAGLRAHLRVLRKEKHLSAALSRIKAPGASAGIAEWIAWFPDAQAALAAVPRASSIGTPGGLKRPPTVSAPFALSSIPIFHGCCPNLLRYAPCLDWASMGNLACSPRLTPCSSPSNYNSC